MPSRPPHLEPTADVDVDEELWLKRRKPLGTRAMVGLAAVILALGAVGVALIVGGDDGEPEATPSATTRPTAAAAVPTPAPAPIPPPPEPTAADEGSKAPEDDAPKKTAPVVEPVVRPKPQAKPAATPASKPSPPKAAAARSERASGAASAPPKPASGGIVRDTPF
jgi:outer membrane biosynthesis protein TonB